MVINEILFNRRWLSSRLAKIIKNFDNYDFLYNQIADNIFEDTKNKQNYKPLDRFIFGPTFTLIHCPGFFIHKSLSSSNSLTPGTTGKKYGKTKC